MHGVAYKFYFIYFYSMKEKDFAKMVTRMIDKKNVLRNVEDYVTDGNLIYKGDLNKDIFYRLRLEASNQLEMDLSAPQNIFNGVESFKSVHFKLLYTLDRGPLEADVFRIEFVDDSYSPFISFNRKYRRLFDSNFEIFAPKTGEEISKEKVHLMTDFGELIVMPLNITSEELYK